MKNKFKIFLAISVTLIILSFCLKSLDIEYNISEKIAEKFGRNNTTGYATLTAHGISGVQNTEEISYVYGNGLVAQVKNGNIEYFHNDYLGSPTVISDSSGNKVSEQNYDVFGANLKPAISTLEFTGKEKDDDTGLHYFNARYYDSSTGKFATPDTVKPKLTNPQSLNLYTYTLNNPLKYVDPTGNQIIKPIKQQPVTASSDRTNYALANRRDIAIASSFYNENVINNLKKVSTEFRDLTVKGIGGRYAPSMFLFNAFIEVGNTNPIYYQRQTIIHETAHMIYGMHVGKGITYVTIGVVIDLAMNKFSLMNENERDSFASDMRKFFDTPASGNQLHFKDYINSALSNPLYKDLTKDSERGTEWFAFTAEHIYQLQEKGKDPKDYIPENILKYYNNFVQSQKTEKDMGK